MSPGYGCRGYIAQREGSQRDSDSFTIVKTKPDKTWEYAYYTANLKWGAGTYTIYALSQPKTVDQVDPDAAHVGIALKSCLSPQRSLLRNVVKRAAIHGNRDCGRNSSGSPDLDYWRSLCV